MNSIQKILFLFVLLLAGIPIALATHYRAGEITYRQIAPLGYEITVITYTDPANTAADRSEMEVVFGDGKSEIVPRSNGNGQIVNPDINNTIKMNIYRTTHTFPGPSIYLINITDPNRVDGIKNINGGQSVNIPFYVESTLTIVAGIDNNQSPVLLLPPVDVGCLGEVFTHNPAAWDPDGDSLTFTIVAPKRAMGQEVPNFTIPRFSDSFALALNTGQLTWSKPVEAGHYNWAILIKEFRGGKLIGSITRDMQVYINNNCDNHRPNLVVPDYVCVEANKLLQRPILATDPDAGQLIRIQYFGGPFVQKNSPAFMTPANPEGPASGVSAMFNWIPSCNAIRYRAHEAVFRVVDNHPTKPLSNIKYWNIKVVGPPPQNVKIVQDSNGFRLSWNRDTCHLALGYKIYRKVDSSNWSPPSCVTGVPASTGYVLYDTTKGVNNTNWFDNNNGKGISPLIRYCYMITSWYPARNEDGSILILGEKTESYASVEVCDIILKTKPIITKVSILKTGISDGKIQVDWIKPDMLDTTQYPAPYRMQLVKSNTVNGTYQNVGSVIDYANFSDLSDESVIDSLLNTSSGLFYYKVLFYSSKNGNYKLTEESTVARSVHLIPFNTNRSVKLIWTTDVPWINTETIIYKKNALNTFDSITSTNKLSYTDTGLINGNTYCYIIETKGNYNTHYYPNLIRNFSQEACGIPIDTIRPCTPSFAIDTPCNSFSGSEVKLSWVYPATCDQDVVKFRIYWKKNASEPWLLLDSVPLGTNTYTDSRESLKYSIAGCYSVLAVDSFNNESYLTNGRCIDNCPYYAIPNVFTPDGDGKNDLLRPFPYRFIDKVNLVIYNRWGQEVYSTNLIDILWNGNDLNSGLPCTEGVYYYVAEVYESYLEGTKKRMLHGTIELIR